MKVKITRPDGTVIEAEGTAEECEKLVAAPVQPVLTPVVYPSYPYPVYPSYPYPSYPMYPTYTEVYPTYTGPGTKFTFSEQTHTRD